MDASAMDRRIDLAHRTLATPNVQGERIASWGTPYASVWAQKIEVSAREYFSAGAMLAEMTTRFRIRWRADVVPTDRVIFEGDAYNIRDMTEIGRREGLELYCSALVT